MDSACQDSETDAQDAEPEKKERGRKRTEKKTAGDAGAVGQSESGLFQVMGSRVYEGWGASRENAAPTKG